MAARRKAAGAKPPAQAETATDSGAGTAAPSPAPETSSAPEPAPETSAAPATGPAPMAPQGVAGPIEDAAEPVTSPEEEAPATPRSPEQIAEGRREAAKEARYGFVCLREKMLVHRVKDGQLEYDAHGRAVYRVVKRGGGVPEAAHWPYRDKWIENGHLGYDDEPLPPLGPNGRGPFRDTRGSSFTSPPDSPED